MHKISNDQRQSINSLPDSFVSIFFGNWTEENKIQELREQFQTASPFEHVVIPNFLNDDIAELMSKGFPSQNDLESMHAYRNPIEVKYAQDDLQEMNAIVRNYFLYMSSNYVTNIFSKISDIDLEHDPFLHGAGIHLHPRNGRLGIHLDYEIHPHCEKQRRLNIIVYMNKDWDASWNGHSELWNMKSETCEVSNPIEFNTAFVFKTNEESWHGVSKKITCPEHEFRKTLAFYYISNICDRPEDHREGQNGSGYRYKAVFRVLQNDPNYEKIEPLLKIRPLRRIEQSDIDEHWPEWNPEEY